MITSTSVKKQQFVKLICRCVHNLVNGVVINTIINEGLFHSLKYTQTTLYSVNTVCIKKVRHIHTHTRVHTYTHTHLHTHTHCFESFCTCNSIPCISENLPSLLYGPLLSFRFILIFHFLFFLVMYNVLSIPIECALISLPSRSGFRLQKNVCGVMRLCFSIFYL